VNHAAKGNEVPSNQRNLADSPGNGLGKDDILYVVNVLGNFIQYRETRADQCIQDVVEKKSRAPPQVPFATFPVSLAFLEEPRQRLEVTRTVNSYDIILTNENIRLAGPGYTILFVKYRKMQHHEQVIFVHINLGTLNAAEDVIQIKRMKMETLSQECHFVGCGPFNVEPG
jgi:hypothetical protein